jgi:hypothetical protein
LLNDGPRGCRLDFKAFSGPLTPGSTLIEASTDAWHNVLVWRLPFLPSDQVALDLALPLPEEVKSAISDPPS